MDERSREPFLAGQISSTLPLALVGTISFHTQLHSPNKQTINQSVARFPSSFEFSTDSSRPIASPARGLRRRVEKYSFTPLSLFAHTYKPRFERRPRSERLRRARPHTFAGVSFARHRETTRACERGFNRIARQPVRSVRSFVPRGASRSS